MVSSSNASLSQGDWAAPFAGHLAGGSATVEIPGSKSLTNRYLLLAAIADSPSIIHAPLRSRDTSLMIQAIEALGAKVEHLADSSTTAIRVHPINFEQSGEEYRSIDVGLAGNVMRFIPPVAALLPGATRFFGDEYASHRPMQPVIRALRELGAKVEAQNDQLPFTILPPEKFVADEVTIDASGSSQFLSALLLAGAKYPRGLTIRHQGSAIPSMPHIEMTLEVMREVGISVDTTEPYTWHVPATRFPGFEITVEPDLSNAGPFLVSAIALGTSVSIPRWPQHTTQGGDMWKEILPLFGATVELNNDVLTVHGNSQHRDSGFAGIDLDLSEAGELAPTVAALCALANSPSRLRGIAHLRGHETNRLEALVHEINAMDGVAQETDDGIEILKPVQNATHFRTYADHRMATAGAVMGLRIEGTVIENIATTSKTLPDFPTMWKDMLDQFETPERGQSLGA